MSTRPAQRPRSISILSYTSNKSHKSNGSGGKIDLTETAKEKSARRMTSKADPTLAMNEAQPAATALEKSTIESIRLMQHRDINGNIITDPDLSNPTRPRLERPLDTIRSFEAAIDGGYQRRSSFARPDTADAMSNAYSRRSSYYFGQNGGNSQARTPGEMSYYGNSQARTPGEGGYFGNAQARTPGEGNYYGNRNGPPRPYSYTDPAMSQNQHNLMRGPKPGTRVDADSALYGQSNSQGVYPSHGYQQSYDTVTTASGTGSHGTDQWGNSTDPSSENSSVDRVNQVAKPDLGEVYGFSGFGGAPQFQGPILEEHGHGKPAYGEPGYGQTSPGAGTGANGYPYRGGNGVPPPTPPHVPPKDRAPRVPIKLGNSSANSRPDVNERRKSWFKRRFSKD